MRGQSFYDWCIENNRENLLSEWEYNKNYPLTPHNCARGTSKKVWWKCKKGHEWQASVGYRAKFARPCPICNGTHTLVTGVNDLMTVNPKLANEWDYDLNGELTPSMILPRSMKKVWWICEKGHRYQSTVDNRTKGSGCPICSKERKTSMPEKAVYFYVLKYFKDAIDNYKAVWLGKSEIDIYVPSLRLAIEYDGERWHQDVEKDKKKDLLLKQHDIVIVRFREPKCPKLEDDSICIITEKPTSNATHMNHAIQKMFKYINSTYNCNINADVNIDRDSIEIFNMYQHEMKLGSLAVVNPILAKEWNYNKNGKLIPEKVFANAGIKVWWRCKNGHEWMAVIASRNNGVGCPFCSGKRSWTGFNDLKTKCPDVAKEWNYEKNEIKGPEYIAYSSNKKVWWKCSVCGFEWQSKVNNRTSNLHTGCPKCAKNLNKQVETSRVNRIKKRGSLLKQYPLLCREWDYDKNLIAPSEVTSGSKCKVWWICPKGHSYQADVNKRTGKKPTGCPYCSGRKILRGYNDLATRYPTIVEEWDYEKNIILPTTIGSGSNRKVWWKCKKCGREWEATPNKRVGRNQGCPYCRKKKDTK